VIDQKKIEAQIAEYPICEYAFIRPEEISFLEQVRYICRTECPRYGHSWSCPPAVGTVEECQNRCEKYTGGFIFTTIAEVTDAANMEETLSTRGEHEKITRKIRDCFEDNCQEVFALSTESCAICKDCTYPEAPCRHPDRMIPCIESYGILVTALAEKHGISFMNEGNVVTWFGLLLYQE
jgi:predicted metal-binding protein